MPTARIASIVSLLLAISIWSGQNLTAQAPQAGAAGEEQQAESVSIPPEARPAETDGEAPSDSAASAAAPPTMSSADVTYALIALACGVAVVLGLIIVLRVNAFIALISAAIVVSVIAELAVAVQTPSEANWADTIARVATAFGSAAGNIGIVIALAAVIGKCMLDSGAADRIVRAFLNVFGERRSPIALTGSGFVLAVPVFFDTVFYLLVPLARSLHRKTGKRYLLYILAIAAGGAVTHSLVPPTPGPLVMAANLNFDVGVMIIVGALVALPAAIAGLVASDIIDRIMPTPMRSIPGQTEPEPLADEELPPLGMSLLPVILPVILISANTMFATLVDQYEGAPPPVIAGAAEISAIFGNANLALLISTVIAMWMLIAKRGLSLKELSNVVEISLMSGGVIILITAGGGAFGAMLKQARVGEAIQSLFPASGAGMTVLMLGFGLAAVLKIAQGSSTVAMITGSAMLAGVAQAEQLGFHPVYLATAIGSGALMGSWMNDSGFWIFAKMGGLTEGEALKSWTVMLAVLSAVGFGVTLLLAKFLPLLNWA